MEIFGKLEQNVKEILVKFNEEKKNLKSIIRDQKNKINQYTPLVENLN
jgi:hypothetical protein